jgi:hypothetical protein
VSAGVTTGLRGSCHVLRNVARSRQNASAIIKHFCGLAGGPDTIRTCDLCLRRAALYPAELRVRAGGENTAGEALAQGALDPLGAGLTADAAPPPSSITRLRPGSAAGDAGPGKGFHLSMSFTASRPACAHISSSSALPPLTPMPPIWAVPAMIGRPPAKATTPGTITKPGTSPPLWSLP